jgi:hypothetical protein
MIVNNCSLGLDGKFVVDTIRFDATGDGRRTEVSGTYKEALLDTNEGTLYKKARLGKPTGLLHRSP